MIAENSLARKKFSSLSRPVQCCSSSPAAGWTAFSTPVGRTPSHGIAWALHQGLRLDATKRKRHYFGWCWFLSDLRYTLPCGWGSPAGCRALLAGVEPSSISSERCTQRHVCGHPQPPGAAPPARRSLRPSPKCCDGSGLPSQTRVLPVQPSTGKTHATLHQKVTARQYKFNGFCNGLCIGHSVCKASNGADALIGATYLMSFSCCSTKLSK